MSAIDDWKDARRAFRRWKRKHPDEKEDISLDPLKLKRFLESKGFTFNMTDEEFVEERRRLNLSPWQRFCLGLQADLKHYSSLSRKQQERLLICITVFVLGFVFFVNAAIFARQASPLFFQPKNFSDPRVLHETLDLVYVLLFLNVIGFFFVLAIVFWSLGSLTYSYYLEGRIKALERGVREKHGSEPDKTQDKK